MASGRPGAEAVVTRLTDALLAQAIRQCLLEVDRPAGPPSAITDPQIAWALRLIRETPGRPWSVPRMAAEVALSTPAQLLGEGQPEDIADLAHGGTGSGHRPLLERLLRLSEEGSPSLPHLTPALRQGLLQGVRKPRNG
jgi:hypothetical protein